MKWSESLRRPDWLKELQAVLVVGLVVLGGLGVFGIVAVGGGSLRLELPASAVSGTFDHELREGAAVAAEQDVMVTVADPSLEQRAVWVLTTLPTYAVVVALMALLLRVVWLARRDDPFTFATVRRLRVLAVIALAGYVGFLVELVAATYLSSTVIDGVAGYSQFPLHWLLVGFGLFAVAEVIKRGCAMRAELETVV
jgi:preprotein translocase subunit Sss1